MTQMLLSPLPQLGLVSDEIGLDLRTSAEKAVACGIRRIEIRGLRSGRFPFCDRAELDEVSRILAGEGLTVTAVSPGLFKMTQPRVHDAHVAVKEVLPRVAEWAERWGFRRVLCFGFLKSENHALRSRDRHRAAGLLGEAAEAAHTLGLELLVEPEPICLIDTGDNALRTLNAAGSRHLGINYDPGNVAWQTGRSPLPEYARVLPFIRHVHVKDMLRSDPYLGDGRDEPRWVPAGKGICDYPAFFRMLAESGYCGEISLEPHLHDGGARLEECRKALEACWPQQVESTQATLEPATK
jgi:sugar phosphate isomerase/epimerase